MGKNEEDGIGPVDSEERLSQYLAERGLNDGKAFATTLNFIKQAKTLEEALSIFEQCVGKYIFEWFQNTRELATDVCSTALLDDETNRKMHAIVDNLHRAIALQAIVGSLLCAFRCSSGVEDEDKWLKDWIDRAENSDTFAHHHKLFADTYVADLIKEQRELMAENYESVIRGVDTSDKSKLN